MMVIGSPNRMVNARFHTYPYLRVDNVSVWTELPHMRETLFNILVEAQKEWTAPVYESFSLRNWMVLAA